MAQKPTRPLFAWSFLLLTISLLSGLSFSGCFIFAGVFQFSPEKSHATLAEGFEKENKFSQAIAEYQKHIEKRLRSERRPEHENPYFYQILIGDLYLRLDQPDQALIAYQLAEQHKVRGEFVSERIRRLAHWHAKREQYQQALDILARYRELDPFMYDIDADSIHKELVNQDQEKDRQETQVGN